jgi:tetratricopeptide (TPR) repeat protein
MIIYPSIFSRGALARALADVGRLSEAMTHAEDALRIAEGVDPSVNMVQVLGVVGDVCLRWHEIVYWLAMATQRLGHAYALCGRGREAVDLLEEAVVRGASIQRVLDQAQRLVWLGEAHLAAGAIEEAARRASEALDTARAHHLRSQEASALRLVAEIATHRDPADTDAGESHYREALTLAGELGMRPLAARAELLVAVDLYRDMAMTRWYGRATDALTPISG